MTITDNINRVMSRIKSAASAASRPADQITLLAVSKGHSSSAISEAYQAGCKQFGENYLQDALGKIEDLSHLSDIQWHFIGPLQSNKTRKVAENFDWVHSIDRLKVAMRLNTHRPEQSPPINLCIQVNIDNEDTKSGVAPNQVAELALAIADLPNVTLRGLMAVPKSKTTLVEQQKPFRQLYQLLHELKQTYPQLSTMDTLSMGMSRDMEAAIHEGATIVRVGTDIFGARDTHG